MIKKDMLISCRISNELYELLRKKSYEERRSQRSIVEEALRFIFSHARK